MNLLFQEILGFFPIYLIFGRNRPAQVKDNKRKSLRDILVITKIRQGTYDKYKAFKNIISYNSINTLSYIHNYWVFSPILQKKTEYDL